MKITLEWVTCPNTKLRWKLAVQTKSDNISSPAPWANQYTRGKGDLFKFEMSDFGFSGDCIKFQYIKRVSIKAGSNDGWKIDSITTHVKGAEGGKFRVLTVDMDVYRWIDGNDEPAMEQFDLTQVWTPPAEV